MRVRVRVRMMRGREHNGGRESLYEGACVDVAVAVGVRG